MMTGSPRASLRIVALVVLAMLLTVPASAQQVALSFEELRALVKAGDTVYVTDMNGRKTKGKLRELSASSLELLKRERGPDGRDNFVPQARLSEREVRWVELEHRDSVLNGTLIGLATGAGLGALIGVSAGCDECTSSQQAAVVASVPLFLGGISAGIGALVDATIHRVVTVYQAPGQRSADVQLVPLLSRSLASLQVAVRF